MTTNKTKSTKAKSTAIAKKPTEGSSGVPDEMANSYRVSARERILRDQLAGLNETLSDQRDRLEHKLEQKKHKLERRINRARARQEARLDRQDDSKLFKHWPLVYYILTPVFAVGRFFRTIWRKASHRVSDFRSRRPNRSFYLTNRGQSKRGIKMSGYLGFIREVGRFIWDNKKLFLKFILVYGLITAIVVGLLSQENFVSLRDSLEEASVSAWVKWPALFSQALTGGSGSTDAGQQVMSVLLLLFGWLTLVWLTRQLMNGNKVNLRDGIYSSGGAVISTFIILVVMLVQLLPLALALLAYSSVTAVGWINSGIAIENMAAWCALAVIAILTLYWMVTSFLSLVIVTLPGMYPFRAYHAAGDLVIGRRLKILLRLIVMIIPVILVWLVILFPTIMLDSALKLTWQPLVPIVVLLLTILTAIWCATYIYKLYRHIIDDPTPLPNKLPKKKFVWPWLKKTKNS